MAKFLPQVNPQSKTNIRMKKFVHRIVFEYNDSDWSTTVYYAIYWEILANYAIAVFRMASILSLGNRWGDANFTTQFKKINVLQLSLLDDYILDYRLLKVA